MINSFPVGIECPEVVVLSESSLSSFPRSTFFIRSPFVFLVIRIDLFTFHVSHTHCHNISSQDCKSFYATPHDLCRPPWILFIQKTWNQIRKHAINKGVCLFVNLKVSEWNTNTIFLEIYAINSSSWSEILTVWAVGYKEPSKWKMSSLPAEFGLKANCLPRKGTL